MRRDPKYVGLDVHEATTVATVRREGGQVLARSILGTEAEAILAFLGGMRGAVDVALEEGAQAQWLYDLLSPRVARVVVCNRRGQRGQGNKGDFVDADRLSDDLRKGNLKAVYHGSPGRQSLQEYARLYQGLVQDATRVMHRVRALYRARGIPSRDPGVFEAAQRETWLSKLENPGARLRAEMLLSQLDGLRGLRPRAKAAMIAEARRDPAWRVLRTIPYLGPVRVAQLLATLKTPWRFGTKRNLWAYAGLAVVTYTSSEYEIHEGRAVRRRRPPRTRGLNRNHNHVVKGVFTGAANAAIGRAGPLRDFYLEHVAAGLDEPLARVTLARKLAAITLHVWKTGESYDPTKLTMQAS